MNECEISDREGAARLSLLLGQPTRLADNALLAFETFYNDFAHAS
jgi:hypothetical protein